MNMTDKELIKCPICEGNSLRWLSKAECQTMGVEYGTFEDCAYCEDGWLEVDEDWDEYL